MSDIPEQARNAADLAIERLATLNDTLKLAEAAPAYIRGEQWAVSAVVALRHEIAAFGQHWLPVGERGAELSDAAGPRVFGSQLP